MRRLTAPLFCLLVGCTSTAGPPSDRVATVTEPFDSAEATLLDFELDGRLVADTSEAGALRSLILAQLMYAVGQLNGDRSVGRYERLQLSTISATPSTGASGRYDVRYHAKLPVAWGAPSRPSTYTLVLPAAAGPADQTRFTAKYGASCVDPEAGDLTGGGRPQVGRMFLYYRPGRAGCELAPEDVAMMTATVTPSSENTTGKYPEYRRIWEDGTLDLVTVFGIESEDEPNDEGASAFEGFLASAGSYLASIQPDDSMRATARATVDGRRRAHLEARLRDDRAVHVDAILIGPRVDAEGAAFDAWYDAASASADVLVYSGHAALGANVRALMTKGTYRAGKYLVWMVNGCDTLAYVDRTLADRRAALNPDDPSGTKYMDTVTNVLGAWFLTGDRTAMRFLDDVVAAAGPNAAPKTYREIFSGIDRDQVVVVTGEEDNEPPPASASPAAPAPAPSPPSSAKDEEVAPPATGDETGAHDRSGCSIGDARRARTTSILPVITLAIFVGARARRALRRAG